MSAPEFVIVLTTLPAGGNVDQFAEGLVRDRLAACVNVLRNMRSVYRWRDEVEIEDECQLVIKTTGQRLVALRERIGADHPYEIPEFVVVPVIDGTSGYLNWVKEATAEAGL